MGIQNLTQAAYITIISIPGCDGEITADEIMVTNDYISNNFDGSFDENAEVEKLSKMDKNAKLKYFKSAAAYIQKKGTKGDKAFILSYIADSILADKVISDGERELLDILSKEWDTDLRQYIKPKNDAPDLMADM